MKYPEEYCKKIQELLQEENIRVNYDNSEESMSKKIRNSTIMKNPITIIIGDNEKNNNLISYRKYKEEKTYSMSIDKFIEFLKDEIKKR